MTATTEHRPTEAHQHTYGLDCRRSVVIYGDYADYIHNGHVHHEDNGHCDECGTCSYKHCSDSYVVCECEGCFCPTCNYGTCSYKHCSDSCSSCVCEDYSCPTCTHIV